ncbi:AfsR/SARP family transcriptional regulator [Actinomadura sp. DC4]|uniref:AfsR/SARP family transcriptional regulator n=1 Tax=Actinomadura sp. DC4 TaxID=3055069 RepID=UPI0025B13A22|nr:AfsR/SARP family transcriptional regulator [Actinomadura sp. DC4]MDN3357774.1 AfsR/SARP family transcriptional regulator [Actinomadura sp. DC4]
MNNGEITGAGGSEPRTLSVGLLGPFTVAVNERPVSLTAGRLRALLAALALSAGRVVSVDHLAAGVWADEDSPANVRRSVQTYMARLRSALGAGAIGSTPAGYVLRTDPERVDALRFVRLLNAASAAPDGVAGRPRLVEALKLWRGTPFEGVPSGLLEKSEAPWLLERYLTALEWRLDLDISAGRHGDLVVELCELTARYPLRESLWARLLVVLDRSGRRADALARYETMRTRIATELGVDPDPTLQRIHIDLLTRRTPLVSRRCPVCPVQGS